MVAWMVVRVPHQGVVAHALEQLLQISVGHTPPAHFIGYRGVAPIPMVCAVPFRVQQGQCAEHGNAPGALRNRRAVEALDQQG
ncbi:hypothetical protein D3C76_1753660 [compost metagenome]